MRTDDHHIANNNYQKNSLVKEEEASLLTKDTYIYKITSKITIFIKMCSDDQLGPQQFKYITCLSESSASFNLSSILLEIKVEDEEDTLLA